jgi:hypothetical protein
MNRHIYLLVGLVFLLVAVITSCGQAAPPASAPGSVSSNSTSVIEEIIVDVPVIDKTKLPVIQFSVSPNSIAPGGTAVLSWNVTNATTVTIDHGIGTVSASGTKNVSPAAPTTYKLTAGNDTGSAIKTASLAVIAATPQTPAPTTKPKPK